MSGILMILMIIFYILSTMDRMITISIIGSAGRNGLMKDINRNIYDNMYNIILDVLKNICDANKVIADQIKVKSGGSALSDHISVSLYINNVVKNIELCLPYKFDTSKKIYSYNRLNTLHKDFQTHTGINSLEDISNIISQDNKHVTVRYFDGYFQRNVQIANDCDYLINF